MVHGERTGATCDFILSFVARQTMFHERSKFCGEHWHGIDSKMNLSPPQDGEVQVVLRGGLDTQTQSSK